MQTLGPEQIAENERLKHLPVICNLQEGQEQIKHSVSELTDEVKQELENHKEEFREGSEKFKQLFGVVAELKSEVGDMKTQISDGFTLQAKLFQEHITQSQNDKIDGLTKMLDNKNHVKDGIIITLVGGGILAGLFQLVGMSGVAQ